MTTNHPGASRQDPVFAGEPGPTEPAREAGRPDSACPPSAAFTLLFLLVLVGPSWADRAAADGVRTEATRIERRLETERTERSARRRAVAVTSTRRMRTEAPDVAGGDPVRAPQLRGHGLPRPRAPDLG